VVDDVGFYGQTYYRTDNKGRQSPSFSVAGSHFSFGMGKFNASRELVPEPGGSTGYLVSTDDVLCLSLPYTEVATSATVLSDSVLKPASSAS